MRSSDPYLLDYALEGTMTRFESCALAATLMISLLLGSAPLFAEQAPDPVVESAPAEEVEGLEEALEVDSDEESVEVAEVVEEELAEETEEVVQVVVETAEEAQEIAVVDKFADGAADGDDLTEVEEFVEETEEVVEVIESIEEVEEVEPHQLAPPRLVALVQAPQDPTFEVTPHLEYRFWGAAADQGPFEGSEQTGGIYQRARMGLQLDIASFEVRAEMDALTGRILGTETIFPTHIDPGTLPLERLGDSNRTVIDPRKFYGVWHSPVGQLQVGLQGSQWGLGLLANNGDSTDDLFNQSYGGDRSFRALFATAPLRPLAPKAWLSDIYLAMGADAVYRDENASFEDGDDAYQALTSLFYQREFTTIGAYGAFRGQTDRNGDTLNVAAIDFYADHSFFDDDARWFFRLGAEAAYLLGSTTRVDTPELEEAMAIRALGVATEVEVRHRPTKLGLKLLSGYASGDASNDDDTLYRFRFDPNYKVGLVLFDQYLPAMTRESYRRINDPERVGQAPRGAEGLVETGAVSNALYINPRFLVGDPNGLLAGVGVLWARSVVPFGDPYNTFANGGTPAGPFGARPASHDLGLELDFAARYRTYVWKDLAAELKGEYGIFFPGEAFADELGERDDTQSLVRVRLALLW